MTNIHNGILGVVAGDAVGVPAEFKRRDTFEITDMNGYGTYDLPPGSWSDDSSMTLCAVESIGRLGRVDRDDIMQNFVRWLQDGAFTPYGKVFDIGNTTYDAIKRYMGGISAGRCGGRGKRDNGNGSLMRILPLAFTDCKDETIDAVGGLTHAHAIAKTACRIYIRIARELMKGKKPEALLDESSGDSVLSLTDRPEFVRLPVLKTLDRDKIRSSGYVVYTLEAALWCLLHTENYRDCILSAVNLGSDTDTVAAIAGGLAGILYGIGGEKGIPEDWINQLAKKDWIIDLCDRMAEVCAS